jgi:hypothetical protein
MDKIPEEVRRGVFFDYLTRMKRKANAEKHGISTGAVSDIVQDNLSRLDAKDPEAMRDLALFCTEHNITLAKLARAISLHNTLVNGGGADAVEDVDNWVTLALSLSKEPVEKVVPMLVEILRESEREGMSPILTLEKIKHIKQEQGAEEEKLKIIKDQTDKANLMCDETLARAGLTKDYADLYMTLAKKMNGWGLTTAEEIVCFVEEMVKLGADAKRAVAEVTSFRKLKEESKELAQEQANKRAKDRLVSLLYDLPLSEEIWVKFSIKARARAIERGEDIDTATERILLDLLDHYDPIHGLQLAILKLHNLKETLEKVVGALQIAKTDLTNTNRSLQQDNEKEVERKRELHDDVNLIEEYKTNLQNDVKEIGSMITKLNAEKKILLGSEKQQQGAAPTVAAPAQAPEPKDVSVTVKGSGLVYFGSGDTILHNAKVMTSGFSPNNALPF